MTDRPTLARRGPLERARLALLLLSPVLLMTVIAVVVSLATLADLGVDQATADAGLARVGDDLALVIVTGGDADLAATRALVANWGLIVPALALIGGSIIAWWLSGRVQRTVDHARESIAHADGQRQSRLQEVIHELRTPLAVMGTNLELAGHGTGSAAEPAKYVDAARRAVDRMSRTVDDLAGHGQLAVETDDEPIDLESLARSIAEENVGPGRTRGVGVVLAGGSSVMVERVDHAAVRTVAGNFMSNAMRLAPQGSRVSIDWGETGDWVWLAVTDEGPGLPAHHHARAFERGWQGSHDRDRRDGSGLGLTIARQLTEAQGGLITLESEEGGGATFALWLPISPDSDPADVVAVDHVHPLARPWSRHVATV